MKIDMTSQMVVPKSQQMIPAWVDGVLTPVEKVTVHRDGLKHPAISIFIQDSTGQQTLLQKRAATKYHTPGLWANACCTHPHWGETPIDAAPRRLKEELGFTLPLTFRGHLEYRADVGDGLIEHEDISLFTAKYDLTTSIDHNPDEVDQTRWISFADLRRELAQTPDLFTPWLRIYMERHADLFIPQI